MGYHLAQISRGELGKPSKIREELEELEDSIAQGNKLMAMLECADIYGALEAVASGYGLTMDDLKTMSEATRRAFSDGTRSAR